MTIELLPDRYPPPYVGCRLRWTDKQVHFGKLVEITPEGRLVVIEEGALNLRRVLGLAQVVHNLSGGR